MAAHFHHLPQAAVGSQQFRTHQHHPRARQGDAHARQRGRHDGRQDDQADALPAREAIHLRHLKVALRQVANGVMHGQRDDEEAGLGHDKHFKTLAYAEQQDKQGDQGHRRQLAQDVERGIDVAAQARRQAQHDAKGQAAAGAQAETGQQAKQADAQVPAQFAALGQVAGRQQYLPWRHQDVRRHPLERGGRRPQQQQGERRGPHGPRRAHEASQPGDGGRMHGRRGAGQGDGEGSHGAQYVCSFSCASAWLTNWGANRLSTCRGRPIRPALFAYAASPT